MGTNDVADCISSLDAAIQQGAAFDAAKGHFLGGGEFARSAYSKAERVLLLSTEMQVLLLA